MAESSRTAMTKADLISVVAKRLDITQVQAGSSSRRPCAASSRRSRRSGVEIRGFGPSASATALHGRTESQDR